MGLAGKSFRLLVLGAQGQIGTELVRRGTEAGFDVTALGRRELDIGDERAVARAISESAPAAIINAAAYTAVDKAESEPEAAQSINGGAPGHIARVAAELGIPLLHISTDYVFDGRGTRPYLEDDPIFPQGVYGASKAAGEDAIRQTAARHIILRTSWVFGVHGHNFLKTMLRLAGERDELAIVNDQKGSPTSADDIAQVLIGITERALTTPDNDFPWGTYHFSNQGETTWCGFARAIVEGAARRGGQSIPVRGISTADYPTPAQRPAYSVLDCSKIRDAFNIVPRPWQHALEDVLDALAGPAQLISAENQEKAK